MENFWVGEHMEVWGDWCPGRGLGSSVLFLPTLPYAPLHPSVLIYILFYNKLVIYEVKCFSVFWECSSKTRSKKGVLGPPIYSWFVRRTDDNLDLQLTSEVMRRVVLQHWILDLWDLMLLKSKLHVGRLDDIPMRKLNT